MRYGARQTWKSRTIQAHRAFVFTHTRTHTAMKYLILVLVVLTLASEAVALREQIGAELSLHAYTGGIFAHSWFGLALTYLIFFGGSVLFVHRADDVVDQIAFHREHVWNAFLGLITAWASIGIFRWPRLTDFEFARNMQSEHTPESIRQYVEENESLVACGGCAKHVDKNGDPIGRVYKEVTAFYWPIFVFVFFLLAAAAGGYLISGRGEPDWPDSTTVPIGITLLVLGGLGIIGSGVWMWYSQVPWSRYPYAARWTLKYFFFFVLFVVPPAFYDYSTLGFIARAFVMWGIYLVLDISFYFYATMAGRDPFFSTAYVSSVPQIARHRPMDAFWWVTLDWLTRAIAYMSMAIANVYYKHDAASAFAAQAIGTVITLLIYVIVRFTLYSGYDTCRSCTKKL